MWIINGQTKNTWLVGRMKCITDRNPAAAMRQHTPLNSGVCVAGGGGGLEWLTHLHPIPTGLHNG